MSIDRTDAAGLIPTGVADEIIAQLPGQSVALTHFKRVTMSEGTERLPVLSTLPVSYFGSEGINSSTTELAWSGVDLVAQEIRTMVPVARAILQDSKFDIWTESLPHIVESIGRTIDGAALFGTNKPSVWPTAIVPAAIAAGNFVALGTNDADEGGVSADFSDAFSLVEQDLYGVDAVVATQGLKGQLRNVRDADGRQLAEVSTTEIHGVPVTYGAEGQWPVGPYDAPRAIVGSFAQSAVLGVRKDISYRIAEDGVFQDNAGAIVRNLTQSDSVALIVTARVAFATAKFAVAGQTGNVYPFAVVQTGADPS